METAPDKGLYVRDSELWKPVTHEENAFLYIDNACVSEGWGLERNHIIIGVPLNDWHIGLKEGQCVQVLAVGDDAWAVCPFAFEKRMPAELLAADAEAEPGNLLFAPQMSGSIMETITIFLGQPFVRWAIARHVEYEKVEGGTDLHFARLFPIVRDKGDVGLVLRWMLNEPQLQGGRLLWNESPKLSVVELAEARNTIREDEQRQELYRLHRPFLERNYANQVYNAIPNKGTYPDTAL